MDQISQHRRSNVALEMGILYAIIILITIARRIPALLTTLQSSHTDIWRVSRLWFTLGEMLLFSAGLVALYGLISLWLANLRFILWTGMGLAIIAGLLYLMAAVTYYQTQGIGPAFAQGTLMCLLSMVAPFLVNKLFGRANRQGTS